MRTLFLSPLLLVFVLLPLQTPETSGDSSVVVLESKWSKSRLTLEQSNSANLPPAAAMIPANKNFERNRRNNAPPGERDPNVDTIDGRSAQLEKNIQESRAPKPVNGFAYRVKVQNAGKKVVEILFWEYQFQETSNPSNVVRRQFLCGVNVKPDKAKEILAYGLSGSSDVISAGSLANKSGNPFQEKVVINRVEYSDGSIWQRKDWSFAEVKLSYARAVGTPWGSEMCRGL